MADYYPLIARAVAGLDPSATGESRRALYERARSALIAQLRGVDPPLSESEITRERLALEEAVRKVEAEAASRARGERPRSDTPAAARPGDALRAATRQRGGRGDEAPSGERPRPPLRPERPLEPGRDPAPRPTARPLPPRLEVPPPDEPPPPPRRPRPHETGRPGAAIRGLRDVVADADDLGRAAAQANRSARRTYANVPSPTPEFDRLEPDMENRGAALEGPRPAADQPMPPPGPAGLGRGAPPRRAKPAKAGANAGRLPHAAGGSRFPVVGAIVLGLVLVLIGLAVWQGPKLYQMAQGLFGSTNQVAQAPKATSPAERPKITDRVGQPASSQTVAPVAQRVVLYDEDPSQPQGKQSTGTVVWRTEEVKGANAQSPELVIRADIDIPERKFMMTITLRRNTDQSLPASHTAELNFTLPSDFDGGGIANVPGILMKSNEQARGTPLAGLAVKVTDNFFLIGLSNVEVDRARNLQLLKERSWIDVPLVYANQRRAIVAIEKGEPGERAFQDAFRAWGE